MKKSLDVVSLATRNVSLFTDDQIMQQFFDSDVYIIAVAPCRLSYELPVVLFIMTFSEGLIVLKIHPDSLNVDKCSV